MKAIRIVALILIIVLTSSVGLSLGSPIEEKESELSQVKKNLDSLNLKFEQAVEEYNQSEAELGQAKKRLAQNTLKLKDAQIEYKLKQNNLAKRLKEAYKTGHLSPISIIIQSTSLRELVENIYFLTLVIQSDNLLVSKLKAAKQKLERLHSELSRQKELKEILVNKVASKKIEVEDAIAQKKKVLLSVKNDLARLQAEERERLRRIREEALRKLDAQKAAGKSSPSDNYNGGGSVSGEQAVEIAKKYLGVKYTWGGTSPETGFDCSGFAWYIYTEAGYSWPRMSAAGQYSMLKSKGQFVSKANLQAGDLVFYGRGSVTDVKIYMGAGYVIGANGGQFIPGEVKITPIDYRSDYYAAGRP